MTEASETTADIYVQEGSLAPGGGPLTTSPSSQRRRQRRYNNDDMYPAMESPPLPPEELTGAYERIDDELNLMDHDDEEADFDLGRASTANVKNGFEEEEGKEEEEDYYDGDEYEREEQQLPPASPSYLNEYRNELHRRGLRDSLRGDQRVRNMIFRDSPVFTKSRPRASGSTMDILQRGGGEQLQREGDEALDGIGSRDHEPSCSSGTSRWNGEEMSSKKQGRSSMNGKSDIRSSIQPRPLSSRFVQWEYDDTTDNLQNGMNGGDEELLRLEQHRGEQPVRDGSALSDIYRNSTFHRANSRKKDDLLPVLARSGSPISRLKTPEQQKTTSAPKVYTKTPIVTGAYINTPLPERKEEDRDSGTVGGDRALRTSTDRQGDDYSGKGEESTGRGNAFKKSPKSGLEAIIGDAKSGNLSDSMGDSTIESLERFKESIRSIPTDGKKEDESLEAYQKEVEDDVAQEAKKPQVHAELGESEKQQTEMLTDRIARLDGELDALKKRRSGKSLRKEKGKEKERGEQRPRKIQKRVSQQYGEGGSGGYNDSLIYIAFPKLFKRNRRSGRFQMTLTGWCVLAFIVWILSESTMCDYYCHPLVAEVCTGNCLMPDAPVFPYVIPTMLWRWLHVDALSTPLLTVSIALVRFILQVAGLWDGFVDDGVQVNQIMPDVSSPPPVVTTPSVAVPSSESWVPYEWKQHEEQVKWDDETISMEEDEYVYV